MTAKAWKPEEVGLLKSMRSQGKKYSEISNALNRSKNSVKNKSVELGIGVSKDSHNEPLTEPGIKVDETEKNLKIDSISFNRSLADVLKFAEIDEDVWSVTRSTVNSANRTSNSNTPTWRIQVWLERKIPEKVVDAVDLIRKRLDRFSPVYPEIKRKKITKGYLLEVSVFDMHFGKLAWLPETGNNYDLRIAETVFKNAVDDLLVKVEGLPIKKILFPVGQDLVHIDNPDMTTVNGTPQDADGRYAKIFDKVIGSCVNAIDTMTQVAPVDVVYVPGNHDRTTSWHACTVLDAWYRNSKDVKIDNNPMTRKYYSHGKCLIGFTHGDEEKHHDLALIMAGEQPEWWAKSEYRTWHLGHWHRRKEMHTVVGDHHGPIYCKIIPSLSGTDAWHYRKGYTQCSRMAQSFLYSEDGLEAEYFARAR